MNCWGFLYYFPLSMCYELCLSELDGSLCVLLTPHSVCMCVCMFDPCVSRQILFLAFRRGIKATRDHGYAVYSNFLWLADECDCVCVFPSRIVGKRFDMHEIPGILFFPSGQIQHAFQLCLFLQQEWLGKHILEGTWWYTFYNWKTGLFSLPLVFKLNISTRSAKCQLALYL